MQLFQQTSASNQSALRCCEWQFDSTQCSALLGHFLADLNHLPARHRAIQDAISHDDSVCDVIAQQIRLEVLNGNNMTTIAGNVSDRLMLPKYSQFDPPIKFFRRS